MAQNELVFAGLGGIGEIGMNLSIYGFGDERRRQWLIVDCGVSFASEEQLPGVDLILPDIRFLIAERKNIVGLVITVAILGVLRSAIRQVGARLMDAVDPALVDQATAAVISVAGITGVRELRIRWIGHTLRAEADISVDSSLTVGQAHDIADHARAHLLAGVRRLTAATIHVSPAAPHPNSATGGSAGR